MIFTAASNGHVMIELTIEEVARFLPLVQPPIEWKCGYCHVPNKTPRFLWTQLKWSLLCAKCSLMQHYPTHIAPQKVDA
jgi:hypothetical protein